MLCGSGGMVPVKAVCHIVVPLPSKTLAAAYFAEASLSAETAQPGRGNAGPSGGPSLSRPISAADVHGPRLPASVRAVSRTYRAETTLKTACLADLSSAQVPLATGAPQFIPFRLTEIEYWPILPFGDVSCRGR